MIKLTRPATPEWLQENYKKWGNKYLEKREKAIKAAKVIPEFQWATHDYEKVNIKLMPSLVKMTQQHCSYCDNFPVGRGEYVSLGQNSIDHFRPKSKFPKLSHCWYNLFLCCDRCQANKGENFCRLWLKPDKIDYDFDKYFILNYRNGAISPNKQASRIDQLKALLTIRTLQLDTPDIRKSRLLELRKFGQNMNIDDFAFRYFLKDKF
jgi:uncharacterized protein (TIGR02646 family)